MFRAIISPNFMSTTAWGTRIMHTRCCRPVTSWVHYTTSCNTQSNAPKDVRNHRPKHVELIGISNKLFLLHLVRCLYYLYQWQTVKQILNLQLVFSVTNTRQQTVWFSEFGFHGSVHHVDCSKWNQRDAVQQVFYCTLVGCTYFGCRRHPSSGAQYVQSRSIVTMCVWW